MTDVQGPIFDRLQDAVLKDIIHPIDARVALAHLLAEALARVGIIDYRSNIKLLAAVDK